jgi:ABC-type dipeptide/oligopeptide/nickel transport system permease component
MIIGNAGSAFPSFVIGPVLILVFAILLKWLPAGGWNDFACALHGAADRAAHHHQRGDRRDA